MALKWIRYDEFADSIPARNRTWGAPLGGGMHAFVWLCGPGRLWVWTLTRGGDTPPFLWGKQFKTRKAAMDDVIPGIRRFIAEMSAALEGEP